MRKTGFTHGTPSQAHEPGAQETDRHRFEDELYGDLHQPDPYENRCHVRKSITGLPCMVTYS